MLKQHIVTLTDLLLGAAYADKRLEGHEVMRIRELLLKLLDVPELPPARSEQIGSFNPSKFNVQKTASTLASLAGDDKRTVLELIASINEADDEIDLAEDAYLRKVALGLGMQPSEFEDLVLEVIEGEELTGLLA